MLFGRILTDGRLNARVKCDLTENLTLKANAQVIYMSTVTFAHFFCHYNFLIFSAN